MIYLLIWYLSGLISLTLLYLIPEKDRKVNNGYVIITTHSLSKNEITIRDIIEGLFYSLAGLFITLGLLKRLIGKVINLDKIVWRRNKEELWVK